MYGLMYGLETLVMPIVVTMLALIAVGGVVFVLVDALDARTPNIEVPRAHARRPHR